MVVVSRFLRKILGHNSRLPAPSRYSPVFTCLSAAGHLAPMLGDVIDLMDHLLPQGIRPAFPLRVEVFNDTRQVGFTQRGVEFLRLALDQVPAP